MNLRLPARLCILLAACTARPAAPAPEDSPPPPVPAAPPAAAPHAPDFRMPDHFRDAEAIKHAVIAGELEDARAPARRLRSDADRYPVTWRPFVAANLVYADAVATARDLRVAGAAAAGLARTCGDCHAALGVGPRFDPAHGVPAIAPHDPRQRMMRHQWAADRMWEALIDRGEYAWMAGAAALAVAPLEHADLTRDVELAEDVLRLNERVHALGVQAGATVGWDARAGLYGEFLATCAGCHKGGC